MCGTVYVDPPRRIVLLRQSTIVHVGMRIDFDAATMVDSIGVFAPHLMDTVSKGPTCLCVGAGAGAGAGVWSWWTRARDRV